MNKFLVIIDQIEVASELKDILRELTPKALLLECESEDVEMYHSSFEDPGCVVFYSGEKEQEIFKGIEQYKCSLVVLKSNEDTTPTRAGSILYRNFSLKSQLPNIKTFLNFSYFKREEHKIEGIENILTTLSERMGVELKRVKSLHEKLVNFRSEDFKGVKVTSKFASGEKPGGEFFDVVSSPQGPIFILSSTSSYVASSILMSQLEALYQQAEFDDAILARVMANIEKEFSALGLDLTGCAMMIMRLELASMKISTFSFGGVSFLLSGEEAYKSKQIALPVTDLKPYMWQAKMERGGNLVILSPGFNRNCDLSKKNRITSLIGEGARDFLTKAFFELKKDRDSSFLEYDASAIYFEVNPNAILQV